MKKFLLMAAVVLSACSAKSQNAETEETAPTEEPKALVAYFSATGNTQNVANQIVEVTGADIFEITPVELYSPEDLDYTNENSRSYVEMHDPSSRPAIKNNVENLDGYTVVFLGYPIWWDMAPTIINTFIENNDLSGKTVIPFATSGSSTIDNSANQLKATYPNLKWKEGKLLNNFERAELQNWTTEKISE